MSTQTKPVVLWFRSDLRLAANAALRAAAATGAPVIPVYILDDAAPGEARLGGASRWWLHHSLAALRDDIAKLGGQLLLLRGSTRDCLHQLISAYEPSAVHWNTVYEPWARELDQQLAAAFGADLELAQHGGSLLLEPGSLLNGSGAPFKVFTPFYKALLAQYDHVTPGALPAKLNWASAGGDAALDDWELLPTRPDWASGFVPAWTPGEAGAQAALERFIDDAMRQYTEQRDVPDVRGTSRLSPHLRCGEITPGQIWDTVQFAMASRAREQRGGTGFLREVVWREFSYHLLHFWPTLPHAPFRENFAHFPWQSDPDMLRAWQAGQTGYPLVDAGMRELWATGWMHNRVRMVVASFLVKHLLIPWQDGAAWFWDTLVDADLANNSASWQWVAGCGADAAPYFRIFNPVLQGTKFDPEGNYVKRWVPELAAVPAKHVHAPWEMKPAAAAAIGLQLGIDYPMPMVDHATARARALAAFEQIKTG